MKVKQLFALSFTAIASLFASDAFASSVYNKSAYNMPQGVTSISHAIYHLHMTIFWICVAIGVGVFSVMIYSMINHRKSLGVKPATFHESLKLEIIWTIIPFIILILMAIPATKVLMQMHDSTAADINIKITGYQWKWEYTYLDEGVQFFSNLSTPQDQIHGKAPKGKWYLLEVDKPLVLPIHKKIRFLITSNDVIHSWWVPDLGLKNDAVPGYIHEAWTRIDKPGTYRGQCAELCGMNHGFMPIVVIAKTQADYDAWLLTQKTGKAAAAKAAQSALHKKWSKAELMDAGKKVYNTKCAICHQPNGAGMPPTFPTLIGSKVTTGPISKHITTVLNGVSGTAMQSFAKQLTDKEIASVITYQRNAWGNDDKAKYGSKAGGLAQPDQIEKAR